jgi:hypothetical protein
MCCEPLTGKSLDLCTIPDAKTQALPKDAPFFEKSNISRLHGDEITRDSKAQKLCPLHLVQI